MDASDYHQSGRQTDYRGRPMDNGNANGKPSDHAAAPQSPNIWQSTSQIFEPLEPTSWLCKDLQLSPGRPALWTGYGSSLKTLALQSLALSAAAGRDIWERFPSSGGMIKHIDYEQGFKATARRYQRLARGMGIERAELGERLQLAVLPQMYLNDKHAVETFARESEGATLVILDALRGAVPNVDENDSRIRSSIDVLTRVSEMTGAAFVSVHHSGKPKEQHADARTRPRGSSAIFDGAGAVFIIEGKRAEPKRVSLEKSSLDVEGTAIDTFWLAVEDVAIDGNPTAGVRVYHYVQPTATRDPVDEAYVRDLERMLEVVRAHGGATHNMLVMRFGGQRARAGQLLSVLEDEGRVVVLPGPRKSKTYRVSDV